MTSVGKAQRFQLYFGSKSEAESALIRELEARSDSYGAKNELLRECIRLGYTALQQSVAGLADKDEMTILNSLADAYSIGGYRLTTLFLHACRQETRTPIPVSKAEESRTPPAAPPLVAAATEAAGAPKEAVKQQQTREVQQQSGRRVDWKKMRGLAGAGGEKKDE